MPSADGSIKVPATNSYTCYGIEYWGHHDLLDERPQRFVHLNMSDLVCRILARDSDMIAGVW